MADNTYPTTEASSHELVMERTFDAPRELVFKTSSTGTRSRSGGGRGISPIPFVK